MKAIGKSLAWQASVCRVNVVGLKFQDTIPREPFIINRPAGYQAAPQRIFENEIAARCPLGPGRKKASSGEFVGDSFRIAARRISPKLKEPTWLIRSGPFC